MILIDIKTVHQHDLLLEVLSWFNDDIVKITKLIDQFELVYHDGKHHILNNLERMVEL